jgi:hypothetical protein
MLERAVSDTERDDTKPGTAVVFTLQRASCGPARRVTPFFCNSIFVYTLIREIGMVAPAKQSKHRERSQ